jgi:hypothetical protein
VVWHSFVLLSIVWYVYCTPWHDYVHHSFELVILGMAWYSLVWFATPCYDLVLFYGIPGMVGTHPFLGYNSLDTDGCVLVHIQVIDVNPAQIKF